MRYKKPTLHKSDSNSLLNECTAACFYWAYFRSGNQNMLVCMSGCCDAYAALTAVYGAVASYMLPYVWT